MLEIKGTMLRRLQNQKDNYVLKLPKDRGMTDRRGNSRFCCGDRMPSGNLITLTYAAHYFVAKMLKSTCTFNYAYSSALLAPHIVLHKRIYRGIQA